jgi:hypothetical protein
VSALLKPSGESVLLVVQQLLRQVEDIKRQVYQNTSLLQQLLQLPTQAVDEPSNVDVYKLPITTLQEMDELEQWLLNTANYKTLVCLTVNSS